jgi:hypothetical protein
MIARSEIVADGMNTQRSKKIVGVEQLAQLQIAPGHRCATIRRRRRQSERTSIRCAGAAC